MSSRISQPSNVILEHQLSKNDSQSQDKLVRAKEIWEGITKTIIFLFNIISLILLIIWLFKIIKIDKIEPTNFEQFITNDSLKNYTEGEFCYGHKYEYIKNGALQTFNIQLEKIKGIAKAILIAKFISVGLIILNLLLHSCWDIHYFCEKIGCHLLLHIIIILIFTASSIVNVIFTEKLSNYFSQSNFYDFERFSKCDYLNVNFKKKYDFINTIKKNCERILIVNFISSILEGLNVCS